MHAYAEWVIPSFGIPEKIKTITISSHFITFFFLIHYRNCLSYNILIITHKKKITKYNTVILRFQVIRLSTLTFFLELYVIILWLFRSLIIIYSAKSVHSFWHRHRHGPRDRFLIQFAKRVAIYAERNTSGKWGVLKNGEGKATGVFKDM